MLSMTFFSDQMPNQQCQSTEGSNQVPWSNEYS